MRKLFTLRPLAAALLACALAPAAQAAATFNPASGELALPSVLVDWGMGMYAITLKRAPSTGSGSATGAPLTLGDEFTIHGAMPNAMPEERNANFLSRTNSAYVPEVVVNTAEGEKTYRLLLQFRPQAGTLRLTSMEDATWYSPHYRRTGAVRAHAKLARPNQAGGNAGSLLQPVLAGHLRLFHFRLAAD